MPTANYDSSLLTQRRRAAALYSFYTSNLAAVNAGQSVRREQPDTQLNEVLTQRHEVRGNTNPTAACPCSEAVSVNPGGANSNNVQ